MENLSNITRIESYLKDKSFLLSSIVSKCGENISIKYIYDSESEISNFCPETKQISLNLSLMTKNNLNIKESLFISIREIIHFQNLISDPIYYIQSFEILKSIAHETVGELLNTKDISNVFNLNENQIQSFFINEILEFWKSICEIQINNQVILQVSELDRNILSDIYSSLIPTDLNFVDIPTYLQISPFLVAQNMIKDSNILIDFNLKDKIDKDKIDKTQFTISQYLKAITIRQKNSDGIVNFLDYKTFFRHFEKYILPFYLKELIKYYQLNLYKLEEHVYENKDLQKSITSFSNTFNSKQFSSISMPKNLNELSKLKEVANKQIVEVGKSKQIIEDIIEKRLAESIGRIERRFSNKELTFENIQEYLKLSEVTNLKSRDLERLWERFISNQIETHYEDTLESEGTRLDIKEIIKPNNFQRLGSLSTQPNVYKQKKTILSPESGEKLKILNITFVLDQSYSMSGEPIEQLKQVFLTLINSIEYYKRISSSYKYCNERLTDIRTEVIGYSDKVHWHKQISQANVKSEKDKIIIALSRIQVEGSTNDNQAIKSIIENINNSRERKFETNLVIYITDGQPSNIDAAKLELLKAKNLSTIIWRAFYIGDPISNKSFNELWNNSDINISGISVDIDTLQKQITKSLQNLIN